MAFNEQFGFLASSTLFLTAVRMIYADHEVLILNVLDAELGAPSLRQKGTLEVQMLFIPYFSFK